MPLKEASFSEPGPRGSPCKAPASPAAERRSADSFSQIWLDRVGAIDLLSGEQRGLLLESPLDPVVEAVLGALLDHQLDQNIL